MSVKLTTVGSHKVTTFKTPEAAMEQFAQPMFKVVTDAELLDENGKRQMHSAHGTRLYCLGNEIDNISSFEHKTEYNADGIPLTTVTITVFGAQVETEFRREE